MVNLKCVGVFISKRSWIPTRRPLTASCMSPKRRLQHAVLRVWHQEAGQ